MAADMKALMAVLLLAASQATAAEPLPDPTRPAIDLGSGAGSGGSESAPDVSQTDLAPRGLQSTIISPQYRAAIINGETVRLGDKIGDSKLVEVREDSVVLQSARGKRVMELFSRANIKKTEAVQKNSRMQESESAQAADAEKAAGGVK